nr:MAG TPA: antirepressor protein [Caudoviricetes sp.]
MNEIKIINKSTLLDKEIDVWGSVEHPLFRANDLMSWLDIKNVTSLIGRVDQDEVLKLNLSSRSGETWFLTEDGLYEVLMCSRKPIAKQFKKGVKKILHEIRTKGGYIATTQNDTPATILARAMKVADEVIAEHEKRIKELEEQGRHQEIVIEQKDAQIDAQDKQIKIAAPKAEYYDQTLNSEDCMTSSQVALDLGITAQELHNKLCQANIIYKQSGQWNLHKPYKGWKLHDTNTYTFPSSNGGTHTKVYTVWTQRGRRFIIALFKNNFNVKLALAEINGNIAK